jgi:DNA repair exonuclease SbcCD ATPase subunit
MNKMEKLNDSFNLNALVNERTLELEEKIKTLQSEIENNNIERQLMEDEYEEEKEELKRKIKEGKENVETYKLLYYDINSNLSKIRLEQSDEYYEALKPINKELKFLKDKLENTEKNCEIGNRHSNYYRDLAAYHQGRTCDISNKLKKMSEYLELYYDIPDLKDYK